MSLSVLTCLSLFASLSLSLSLCLCLYSFLPLSISLFTCYYVFACLSLSLCFSLSPCLSSSISVSIYMYLCVSRSFSVCAWQFRRAWLSPFHTPSSFNLPLSLFPASSTSLSHVFSLFFIRSYPLQSLYFSIPLLSFHLCLTVSALIILLFSSSEQCVYFTPFC